MTQDDRLAGLVANAAIKNPCRVASTVNLAALSGLLTVDGVVLVADDRVLVKNQTSSIDNGIYIADSGDWERAKDFDGSYDAVNGTLIKVNSGTQAGFWYAAGTDPITIDTDAVTFTQASSVLAIISAFAQTLLDDTTAAQARSTLGCPSTTEAILQTVGTTKGDVITFTAASTSTRKGVGSEGYRLSVNAGDTDGLRYLPPGMGFNLINGYLDWTVAGNALTCTVKGYDGNAPSATNPVFCWIRSATAATGIPTLAKLTSATTASLSAGSTGGTRNAIPFNVWAVLADDAGTYRLGLVQCVTTVAGAGAGSDVTQIYPLGQFPIASSTAEGGAGAADSAQTIYSTTAWAAKPYAVLGFAYFAAGQAAAGTWATAPTRQHLYMPGTPLPGQSVGNVVRSASGAVATGTTAVPWDNSIPQISEGDQYLSVATTPTSAANLLKVVARIEITNTNVVQCGVSLHQDATLNALVSIDIGNPTGGSQPSQASLDHLMLAATTAATTMRIRGGGSTGATTTFNGSGGARIHGGTMNSYIEVSEIMG